MKLRQVEGKMVPADADCAATMERLAAVIVHEVAQPISATLINAQAAMRKLDGDLANIEEVRQVLGRIVRDANRAAEIITGIRALANMSPPRRRAVEINEVVCSTTDLLNSELLANRVAVQARLAASSPVIAGDRTQLQQVLFNLIRNAIAAMKGTTASARHLTITTERLEPDAVLVGVRDSGPGLVPGQLERIFEAFYTTKSCGMGMGLSICRTIVESHGGRLWAAPNVRSGAVFQFTLPIHTAKDRSSSASVHDGKIIDSRRRGGASAGRPSKTAGAKPAFENRNLAPRASRAMMRASHMGRSA